MSAQIADLYPRRADSFYDRGVWPIGEDADQGILIEGQDARALAAYSAWGRDINGTRWWNHYGQDAAPQWVVFWTTCGHTEEQHVEHLAADVDCGCHAEGLPPCERGRFSWTYELAREGERGAVPVLEVRW